MSATLHDWRLSILVAFRGEGHRLRLWDFVRERIEEDFPEAELVIGTDDGEDPFHKTLALSRAAERASGDVLGIWDADTIIAPARVEEGLAKLQTWIRPWFQKIKLSQADTEALMAGDDSVLTSREAPARAENRNNYWAAPPTLITREAWDEIYGMEPFLAFRGWGQEDDAMSHSLRGLFGPAPWVGGMCFHLWHPRLGVSGNDRWEGQEWGSNRELGDAFRRAGRSRSADQMRTLLADMRAER